jgi:hypothetical protein
MTIDSIERLIDETFTLIAPFGKTLFINSTEQHTHKVGEIPPHETEYLRAVKDFLAIAHKLRAALPKDLQNIVKNKLLHYKRQSEKYKCDFANEANELGILITATLILQYHIFSAE